MYKKIIVFIVLIISIVLLLYFNKNSKFYLEDKYYNSNDFIKINATDYDQYKNDSFILFTFNNFCNLPIPCEDIFKDFINKNNIAFLYIPFDEFKKTKLFNKVKYAPSVIIVNHGNIVAYLDAEKDDDLDKYQNEEAFEEWINNYIYLKK